MNFNKFQKISISFLLVIFLFSIFYFLFSIPKVLAGDNTSIDISCAKYKYPWCQEAQKEPGALVGRFYIIALGLAGASALGVLIYGAILWTLSGAVTSKQDALEWIKGALWGLTLLLAAYLILYTINPDLVKLKNPEELFEIPAGLSVPSAPSVPSLPSTSLPYKDSKSAAQNLWMVSLQKQVSFSNDADCMPGSDAESVIKDTKNGQPIMVCSPGCTKTTGCQKKSDISIHPELLNSTAQISLNVAKLKVTSLTGGNHAVNSPHYNGTGMDVVPYSNNPKAWEAVVQAYNSKGLFAACDLNGIFYNDCSKIVGHKGAHIHVNTK